MSERLSLSDRLPPYSAESECGVIGCILVDPKVAMPECVNRFTFEPFYDLRHQTIYKVLSDMWDAGEPIDMITVSVKLNELGVFTEVGGFQYLDEATKSVPSAHNIAYYVGTVIDRYLRRRMIQQSSEICQAAYDESENVSVLVDRAQGKMMELSNLGGAGEERPIKELIRKALDKLEEMHARQGELTGVPTGFTDLDKVTGGLQPAEMIVIAARPSAGKTSIAMNIAEYVAVDLKLPVGVFSLEMTAEALALRMLTSRARVNVKNARDGILLEKDFPGLTLAAGKISTSNLHIDDSSGLSILQLRSRARTMHRKYGIKLFVIDYLQLLHSTNERAKNREQEIADISRGVKGIAKELNVPVLVLAQLNREIDKEKFRKPRVSDLRESGAIEADADVVGLLYKPADPDNPDRDKEELFDGLPVNLLIAKQRNGPAGVDVNFVFLKSITRFEAAAKVYYP